MIKLGDFGIAKVLSSTFQNARTLVGTPYYLSPEIIESKPYSYKSDIWSLGVVLYELCALRPPFLADTLHFLAMKIVKGNYPPIPQCYSKDLRNLVDLLLRVDATKRPSINQILALPLIQNRIQSFLSQSQRFKEFSHTVLHKQVAVDSKPPKMQDVKSVNKEEPMPAHLVAKMNAENHAKELRDKEKDKEKEIPTSAPNRADRYSNPPPASAVGGDRASSRDRPKPMTPAVGVQQGEPTVLPKVNSGAKLQQNIPRPSVPPQIPAPYKPTIEDLKKGVAAPGGGAGDKGVKPPSAGGLPPRKDAPLPPTGAKPTDARENPRGKVPDAPGYQAVSWEIPKDQKKRPTSYNPGERGNSKSKEQPAPAPAPAPAPGPNPFDQGKGKGEHGAVVAKKKPAEEVKVDPKAVKPSSAIPTPAPVSGAGHAKKDSGSGLPKKAPVEPAKDEIPVSDMDKGALEEMNQMIREMEDLVNNAAKLLASPNEDEPTNTGGKPTPAISERGDEDREDDVEEAKENGAGAQKDKHLVEFSHLSNDETIEYIISDTSKSQALRSKLEERVGKDVLNKIYNLIREEYDKTGDIDKIEDKFVKAGHYKNIVPGINVQLIEQNLALIITLIVLEEREHHHK